MITPPGIPAGKTLSLDSFAFLGDPLILTASYEGLLEYEFPKDVRVDLRQAKVFTATKIAGRIGTVKEVAGYDDWQVTIRFMLVSPFYNTSMPMVDSMIKKLKDLKEVWEKRTVLQVLNQRLNGLGIEYLFLREMELPDGDSYWLQPVTIQALSDEGD